MKLQSTVMTVEIANLEQGYAVQFTSHQADQPGGAMYFAGGAAGAPVGYVTTRFLKDKEALRQWIAELADCV